jgi:hypothetical protein
MVVGTGSDMDRLHERALALRVEECCVIPGLVPYDEVPTSIAALDVGVSFVDPGRHVRTGNAGQKVRQYLAPGRPVVVGQGGHEFPAEHDLGTSVDDTDIGAATAAAELWFSLNDEQRETFTERAAAYAAEHLSEAGTLRQRLGHWSRALTELRAAVGA